MELHLFSRVWRLWGGTVNMMCPFPVEGFSCTCGGGAGTSEFFIAPALNVFCVHFIATLGQFGW